MQIKIICLLLIEDVTCPKLSVHEANNLENHVEVFGQNHELDCTYEELKSILSGIDQVGEDAMFYGNKWLKN